MKLKSLFLILMINVPIRCSFAGSCNPNQDCMVSQIYWCPTWKYPKRACQRHFEDLLCAAARKVCQKDCNSINKDAGDYIFQFRAEIQRVESEITTIDSSLLSESHHIGSFEKIAQETKMAREQIIIAIKDVKTLVENTSQLEAYIEVNQMQNADLASVIESTQHSDDPLISLLGITLEKALTVSEATSTFFNSNHLQFFFKTILNAFEQEVRRLDREIQSAANLIQQTQTGVATLMVRRSTKEAEILNLRKQIQAQEARKCTPW